MKRPLIKYKIFERRLFDLNQNIVPVTVLSRFRLPSSDDRKTPPVPAPTVILKTVHVASKNKLSINVNDHPILSHCFSEFNF